MRINFEGPPKLLETPEIPWGDSTWNPKETRKFVQQTQVTELKLEPILHVLRGKRGKFVDTPKVSLSKYHMYTYCICRYVC